MSQSIRKLLDDWEYDSGKNIRIINDKNGNPVMQVREMMGISEFFLEGRPDGSSYKGFNSVLDEVLSRLDKITVNLFLKKAILKSLIKKQKCFITDTFSVFR